MLFCLLVSYLFFILFFRHLRNSFPFLTLDFYKDSFRSILNFLCSVVLWSIFILVFLWSLVCLTSYLHLLITALVYTNVHILSHFITILSTFVYIYHINKFKNKRFFVKKKDGPNINREDNSYAKKQIKQTRTPTKNRKCDAVVWNDLFFYSIPIVPVMEAQYTNIVFVYVDHCLPSSIFYLCAVITSWCLQTFVLCGSCV